MKYFRLPGVIALMAFALVGLVCIQVYWVHTAYYLQEAQFDQSVKSALTAVANKLETQEARAVVQGMLAQENLPLPDERSLLPPPSWTAERQPAVVPAHKRPPHAAANTKTRARAPGNTAMRRQFDSLRRNFDFTINGRSIWDDTDLVPDSAMLPGFVVEDRGGYQVLRLAPPTLRPLITPTPPLPPDNTEELVEMEFWGEQIERDEKKFASERARIIQERATQAQQQEQLRQRQQKQMANLRIKLNDMRKVMHDVLYNPKPIYERIDTTTLQNLLQHELEAVGVRAEYQWAIRGQGGELYRLASYNTQPQTQLAYNFRTTLFPSDVLPGSNHLLLAFPRQNFYLYSQIAWVLSASGLFMLVILGTFGYTVRTILHQKKLGEMKTDFINNMTHEFKTPIATIALATEALQQPAVQRNDAQQARFTGIIQEENKRLQGQVERVLQMAEIDRGQLALDLQFISLNAVLQDAIQKIALQVDRRGGHIALNMPAAECTIHADALHIGNICYNLLDNANKYSPDPPAITVNLRTEQGWVFIEVSDQGIGMTPEQQRRAFEKFYRVHTGNLHDVKGFGLGLSYVKSLTEAMGGHVTLRSELGRGSRFTLSFPLIQTQA